MESLRNALLALSVALLFIPLGMVVKKFTSYDTSVNFRVTFDPTTCYACKDCPCKYTVNNGDTFILSSHDKSQCTTDHEKINEGIRNGSDSITVEMTIQKYRTFYDCLQWFSQHPTVKDAAR